MESRCTLQLLRSNMDFRHCQFRFHLKANWSLETMRKTQTHAMKLITFSYVLDIVLEFDWLTWNIVNIWMCFPSMVFMVGRPSAAFSPAVDIRRMVKLSWNPMVRGTILSWYLIHSATAAPGPLAESSPWSRRRPSLDRPRLERADLNWPDFKTNNRIGPPFSVPTFHSDRKPWEMNWDEQ